MQADSGKNSGPGMKKTIDIAFSDFWHPNTEEGIRSANSIYRLLRKRFDLNLSSNPDFLIYSCFGHRYLKYDCTRIFYTGENQRPDFSECDYAFSFDYPVSERNYRLPLYRAYQYYDKLVRGEVSPELCSRSFCNFVYSNRRANERIRFFRLLNAYRKVESAGKVLNNVGFRAADKHAFQAGYKFSIAFENASHPGYTTEKIYDALIANTVPIYWGDPLVENDFNPECFINCHRFDSFEAVVAYVRQVDQDDELYMRHLSAPVFRNGMEPAFLAENAILDRFEKIFSGPTRSEVARRLDRLHYLTHPGRIKDAAWRLRRRYQ